MTLRENTTRTENIIVSVFKKYRIKDNMYINNDDWDNATIMIKKKCLKEHISFDYVIKVISKRREHQITEEW